MTLWITNNFLNIDDFQDIQKIMLGEECPWYYMDNIDTLDDVDKFQFTHAFYDQELGGWLSEYNLNLVCQKLKAKDLYRIKANLLTRTPKIEVNTFHTDIQENSDSYTTSILYMNNNNGYTEFEDGTKVESVANRLISFPSGTKHRGTSCTDKKIRVLINFNYRE
jgi:hypothetical protein